MNEISISIIIPTYNRADTLINCLKALFDQTCPKNYEIIIIDDGSTDRTEEVVKEMQKKSPVKLFYFKQRNKGPAAARNLGVKKATGDIVLFVGDDIIAGSDLLLQHILFHRKYPESMFSILGYVTWYPEINITPFMHWLEHGGSQFKYYKFRHGNEVDFFWTCNISLKRDFMLKNGFFDEDFPYAAHEDTELGYRLQKKSLQIIFNRNAVAYHYHPLDMAKYFHRQILVGRSLVILNNKWPSVFQLPTQKITGKIILKLIGPIVPRLSRYVSMLDKKNHRAPPKIYSIIMFYYQLIGVEDALAENHT